MRLMLTLALAAIAFAAAPALADPATEDAEVIFEDRFEGELGEGWSWIREDEADWRLREDGPGLEIRVVAGDAHTVVNALVREAPDRAEAGYAFEITVENLKPFTQQWEQTGMTWYYDGQPVTKLVKERLDGEVIIFPSFDEVPDNPIRLRLEVRGNTWRAMYKVLDDDAQQALDEDAGFTFAGEGELPPAGEGDDRISLQGYHGPADAEHWIRYTDFRITRLAD